MKRNSAFIAVGFVCVLVGFVLVGSVFFSFGSPLENKVFNGQYFSLTLHQNMYAFDGTPTYFAARATPLDPSIAVNSVFLTWKVNGVTMKTEYVTDFSVFNKFNYTFPSFGADYTVQCVADCQGIVYTMPFSETVTGDWVVVLAPTPSSTPTSTPTATATPTPPSTVPTQTPNISPTAPAFLPQNFEFSVENVLTLLFGCLFAVLGFVLIWFGRKT